MPDESLLTFADEVRGKTLRLLDGVPPELARFTGPGLSNSTLWHAGHALVLVEHLCILPATGVLPQYPPGWSQLFDWSSRPASMPTRAWPDLSDVVTHLRDQLPRLRAAIAALSPQQLDAPTGPGRSRTLRYSIVHGLHDEANHQGEIYLLRKLYVRHFATAAGGNT